MAHSDSGYATFAEPFDFRIDEQMRVGQAARWDELREQCPVHLTTTTAQRPVWYLLGYNDVHAAFQDWETFSSTSIQPWETEETRAGEPPWIPVEIDPPLHTQYRALVSPFFSPRAVADMAPAIREQCAGLIDSLHAKGRIEFVGDFAKVFPTRVFMRIMGLPVERSEWILHSIDTLMHTDSADDPDGQIRQGVSNDIYGFLGALLDERRREPQHDIITAIVTTPLSTGRLVSQQEALSMTFLLYMAGLDTVAAALAYMFAYLAGHGLVRSQLTAGQLKANDVAEELLRTHSLINTGRVVTRDIEFAGCPMRKGDRVLLSTAAANRDPVEFGSATDIEVGRRPNRHLAFGAGPHRCLGSHLARIELKIALEEWHRRIPHYRIPDGVPLEDQPGSVSTLKALPLQWDRD